MAVNEERSDSGTRVVIVGGGVAGLEALLALNSLAGDRVALTLVAPQPDFVYKPLLVEEPFDLGPAERHELGPLAEEKGAQFVLSAVTAVRPEDHVLELDDGSTLDYDYLLVAVGGRFRPALEGATTFPTGGESFSADEVLDRAVGRDHRLAFVVPAGVTWSLPLYELALMTQRRGDQTGDWTCRSRSSPPNRPRLRSSARRQARPSASCSRQGGSTSTLAQRCGVSTKAESP